MKFKITLAWIALLCWTPLATEAFCAAPSLHVIALEGDPGDAYWAGQDSVRALGFGDFPTRFSRLYVPVPPPEGHDLGLAIPSGTATLDINQWQIPGESESGGSAIQSKIEADNAITGLLYRLEFLTTDKPVRVRLNGEWKGKKFDETDITVWHNRPTLLAIRIKNSEGLFFALTRVDDRFETRPQDPDSARNAETAASPAGLKPARTKPPELLSRTEPPFPKAMIGHSGKVVLLVVVRSDGSLDPERVRVIRSPHIQFLKASLKEIFKNWRFRPGERMGQRVDVIATIQVVFRTENG